MEEIKLENKTKPKVTLIIPGYNEEAIVASNLIVISEYMKGLEDRFDWELVFVNDGSIDRTGELAEEFSKSKDNVKVIHHIVNLNLGNALKTGFANSSGEYIVSSFFS